MTDPAPGCPGFEISGVTLTCSSPPAFSTVAGKPTDFVATLANGSTVTGTVRLTPVVIGGEPCHGVGASSPITVTFGLTYVGRVNTSAVPACVSASKVDFTQFAVGGGLFNEAWNPTIKSNIHNTVLAQLDQALVDTFNTTKGLTPRCASYQPYP
jgi:hypothetical protein